MIGHDNPTVLEVAIQALIALGQIAKFLNRVPKRNLVDLGAFLLTLSPYHSAPGDNVHISMLFVCVHA
jgi:hypothetical protein